MTTTNFSRLWRSASSRGVTHWLSLVKVVETSLQTFHVCYADFFPLPQKADSVASSQCVKEWESTCFLWTDCVYHVVHWIHGKFPPWPNAIHIFSRPSSFKDHDRYGNNYHIRVVCLNHKSLNAVHCRTSCVHKNTWVCLCAYMVLNLLTQLSNCNS